ncbi:MAG: protease PrsW [Thermoplasmata archaeon]|nr:protease PrsW [Thermoplasmata archaeon]
MLRPPFLVNTAIVNGVIISSIVVTLFIMWFSLRKFEGYFSEKKLFLSFLAGIAMGFVVIIIEFLTSSASSIVIFLLFPLMEQLSKLMILNYRTFREKKDTPIYGLAVGLGFGSIFVPISTLVFFRGKVPELTFAAMSIIIGLALIFLHGATGSMIGYGIGYMGGERKWYYFFLSVIAVMPVRPITVIPTGTAYVASIVLVYGVIIYTYAVSKFLLLALPRRERRLKKSFN